MARSLLRPQENNHIVILDGKTGTVRTYFSVSTVDLESINTKTDGQLKFTDKQEGRKREPDARSGWQRLYCHRE